MSTDFSSTNFLIFFVSGFVIGFIFLFFLSNFKIQKLKEQIANLREILAASKEKLSQMESLSIRNKEFEISQDELRNEILNLKTKLGVEEDKNKTLLMTEENLSNKFKSLANDILDEKSKKFINFSHEKLGQLISPFKNEMSEFSNTFKNIQKAASKERIDLYSELKAEISNMKEISLAFKHQTKVQGIYGEFVLEKILDSSGLRRGHEYKTQVSIKVDSVRKIPDVIIYLPDNKHLVIDAKVSLNAYIRYVNSHDEFEKKQALKDHADAFKSRIKELGKKTYHELPDLNSPEMVFMFVPMESAFIAAIQADERIFQTALENKIVVATPTTLATNLKIVKQLWRFEDQNKNSSELASRAAKIHTKLVNFVQDMEKVGLRINDARSCYDDAMSKLTVGQGNLINQAREFEKLGVSVKKNFSQEIIVKSELNLKADE